MLVKHMLAMAMSDNWHSIHMADDLLAQHQVAIL